VSEERREIPEEEKVLFTWIADERPFEKKGKEFFSTVVVLALLISIILYFIEGVMPVLVVWAIVFMVWAVYRTEPGKVKNAVTNKGLITGENFYDWGVMESFWFEGRGEQRLLRVLLNRFPGQIILVCGKEEERKVEGLMKRYVRKSKPQDGWSDKMAKWMKRKMPLE